jgi:hypothetical protein
MRSLYKNKTNQFIPILPAIGFVKNCPPGFGSLRVPYVQNMTSGEADEVQTER